MGGSIKKIRKKPGRPATGQDPVMTLRFPPALRSEVEAWARQLDDKPKRSEAIRRLVEIALATKLMKFYQTRSPDSITIRQVKAARALVGWSQSDLADHSGMSEPTIARLESTEGRLGGRQKTIRRIRGALESAGVQFTNGDQPGVRLSKRAAAPSAGDANVMASAARDKASRVPAKKR
jgi:transcriptional regulator with XRE-family HTH domain